MAICLHKLCGVSYNTFDTFGDEGELNSDGVIWTTMGGTAARYLLCQLTHNFKHTSFLSAKCQLLLYAFLLESPQNRASCSQRP